MQASSIHYDWFRGNAEFPRKVLVVRSVKTDSYKYVVNSYDEFVSYINKENNTNCYTQIFSSKQIDSATFDTMYLDIDVHQENVPYEKRVGDSYVILKAVMVGMAKKGVKPSRVYFTGRGFAVYVDFKKTKFSSRAGYKFAVRSFLRDAGIFDILDPSVLGDVERVARLPNTINGHTEKMHCVRIDPEWDTKQIFEASRLNKNYESLIFQNTDFGEVLKRVEDTGNGLFSSVENENVEREPLLNDETRYPDFPKCMQVFYDEIVLKGTLDHYQRVNLAIFLLKIWGYEKTKTVISWAEDYRESETTYQLGYLINRKMKMYSCKRFKQENMCPFADDMRQCRHYRLSNGWVEKIIPMYKEEPLNKNKP